VADHTLEIGGTSCPGRISYDVYDDLDADEYVSVSTAGVRAAFGPLITHWPPPGRPGERYFT
jgi:hypothetical protein